MNTTLKDGTARLSGRLALWLAAAIFFLFGQVVNVAAQSPASGSSVAKTNEVANAETKATSQLASAVQQRVRKEERSGSNHEGITVHGHWTIEVRNPDGTTARRVEFENGFCLTQFHGIFLSPGGDSFISDLALSRVVIGSWEINLGPNGVNPCSPASTLFRVVQSDANGGSICGTDSSCFGGLTLSGTSGVNCVPGTNPPSCSPVPVSTTLAGQFTANQSGTISAVSTVVHACGSTITPSACLTTLDGGTAGKAYPMTGTTLTGTGTSPAPVSVAAGQTVAVNVALTFQ